MKRVDFNKTEENRIQSNRIRKSHWNRIEFQGAVYHRRGDYERVVHAD